MKKVISIPSKIIKLLRVTGKYIFMYIMMLMPRDKNLYVFGAWLGKRYADNSKQLFLEAGKHDDIRAVWISREQSIVDEIMEGGREAYKWNTLRGIWCQMRAKYAIVSNGISDLQHTYLGGAIFLDLWHGVPLKKIVYDNKYEKNWDGPKQRIRDFLINRPLGKEYYVATSENFVRIYQSAFRKPKSQILCIGQPRCDVFFEKEKPKPYFPDKKIILYCPTHRNEGAKKMEIRKLFDLQRLEEYLSVNDYYFVVKKHFYHRGETEDFTVSEDYPHILDVTGEDLDVQRLAMEAKAMVTDYSSIYIDYLLLGLPILFYCYDYEQYLKEDREMYFNYDDVTPGKKAKNFDELFEMLKEVIENGSEYGKAEREKARDFFFCSQGQGPVSEIILDKLKSLE